jgi:hypothetical protein
MKPFAGAGLAAALCLVPLCSPADGAAAPVPAAPAYAADGRLLPPAGYREWTFLTSSLDLDYRAVAMPGHHMFDNVFVQPEAYQAFLRTGTWPDHTVIAKELRGAASKGSITRHGRFQTPEVMELELHVKDSARFPDGGWAFFVTDGSQPAQPIPAQADCYSCHREHSAVDNTFVQFYPTLLPVAQQKGTLSESYLKEQ